MNLFSFPLSDNGIKRTYLSVLNPADKDKFSTKAIVGYLIDEHKSVSHLNIQYNPEFLDLFHKIIVLTALRSHEVIAEASIQQTGYVYITDLRNPSDNADRPEDIVGSFEVKNGILIPLSYQPNPSYQLISDSGMFKIPGDFDQYLELAVMTV